MRVYISCLLILLSVSLRSQIITVVDQETGEPLILATIASQSSQKFVTTSESGQADISIFHEDDTLNIRQLGYKEESWTISRLKRHSYLVQLFQAELSLDGILVTATRIQQDARELPYTVSSLAQEHTYLQNPQTAADLLGSSGKVFIQKSQQGGGSPMIRGFSTNRLLYAVDGVRMNTAIFRSGNLQNVISLDPFAIERTDIYFGPGSIIYGSDAIGGVMSFQTLAPQFSAGQKGQLSGQANMRYATANKEKTGHLHLNLGLHKWAFLTSATISDYDDLKMGTRGPLEYLRLFYVGRIDSEDVILQNADANIQIPSGYSQFNLMQKIRFEPNENWKFNYGFHLSATSEYSRYDRHIRYKSGQPRYGQWDYGPQKWLMNHLQIEHKSRSILFNNLAIRLGHQQFEESRIDRDIHAVERHNRTEQVAAYSINLDLSKNLSAFKNFFYGIEGVLNDVTSLGINENINTGDKSAAPSRYPQARWTSFGAYATYHQKASDQFSWQSGLRFNNNRIEADFDTTFYDLPFTMVKINNRALTGTLGFVFHPDRTWALSANIANGFRAPNVDDMGKIFDLEPGSVVVANPDLQAEVAYNFEIGITKIINEFIKVDFSAYYTYLDNAMVRRNYSLNGKDSIIYDGTLSQVQAIQNAAKAEVYGLQAGLQLRLPVGIVFTSDINFQKGTEELDDETTSPSRHAAPTYGVTRLKYSGDRYEIQGYAVYSAGKDFADLAFEEKAKTEIYAIDKNGLPYSPGWYTLNFKASYKINERLTLNFGLENLTDQRYRPYSSGIAAAGRNAIVSLRANI